MDVWDFCPGRMVPRTKPPQATVGVSMNGWQFSSRPTVPFQKTFLVKLHGLTWYLNDASGLFDPLTDARFNARRFEQFYEEHGTWKPFTFPHPHFGNILCRFAAAPEVPEGIPNSGGLIEGFDVQLVEHNPGY